MKNLLSSLLKLFVFSSAIITLNSCDGGDTYVDVTEVTNDQHDFPPFYVSDDHQSAVLDGVIDSNSYFQFTRMLSQHTNIRTIFFDQALGSLNDDVTFQIGRLIDSRGIDTHLLSNGTIASGAVDIFLAGRNRTRGFNTLVGVNSWSDSFGNEGANYPSNSIVHDFYLNYYTSIGYSSQFANDFYFFSIDAASSNQLYYLNEGDIQFYRIFTN